MQLKFYICVYFIKSFHRLPIHRDIRNSNKIEHIIQVQLRFCLLETSCEQDDYFPPNVVVKVNNKLCQLPVSILFS